MKYLLTAVSGEVSEAGRENLRLLAAGLRELPDVVEPAYGAGTRGPVKAPTGFNLRRWHCGTTACAVGHGCFMPALIERGLFMAEDDNGYVAPTVLVGPDEEVITPARRGEVATAEQVEDWEAVCFFFDLNDVQVTVKANDTGMSLYLDSPGFLFGEYWYGSGATPSVVASRIDLFLSLLPSK